MSVRSMKMEKIQLYIGLMLIISWTYFCIAKVNQQHAKVVFYNDQYITEARAFTGRRGRGDSYLSNFTFVTRVQLDNKFTIKVDVNLKSIGTIAILNTKYCDSLKQSWFNQIRKTCSNITGCPTPADRYKIFNLELPPKNFPFIIPNGEGRLNIYMSLTDTNELVLHAMMDVVIS